ncbi:MAG: hypothetical protein IKZ67_04105, partial [Paludibacteraceae bacterium]|nr:hypothetical protein [Paludibacteraceae bacterium]
MYTIVATSAKGCASATQSQTITVNAKPNIQISCNPMSKKMCLGETATLTATGGVHYVWGTSNGLTVPNAQDSSTAEFKPVTAGRYTLAVTGEGNNGCRNTEEIEIEVYNLPEITAVGGGACQGDMAVLSAKKKSGEGNLTFVWEGSSSTLNGATIYPIINRPESFSVYGTDDHGCRSKDTTVTAELKTRPAVTISTDAICEGSDAKVTFQGNDISIISIEGQDKNPGSAISLGALSESKTYNAIVTGENGCSTDTSFTINVEKKPVISFNPSTEGNTSKICLGDDITIQAINDRNADMAWVSIDGLGSPVFTTNDAEFTLKPNTPREASPYQFKVTATNKDGLHCHSNETYNIIVFNKSSNKILGDSAACTGSNLTLQSEGAFSRYSWTEASEPNRIISSAKTLTEKINVDKTYILAAYDDNGCETKSQINVKAVPVPSFELIPDTKCEGEATTTKVNLATATPSTGVIYDWGSDGRDKTEITETLTSSKTYSVVGIYEYKDENGVTTTCASETKRKTTIINPKPEFTIFSNNTADNTVCKDHSIKFYVAGTGDRYSYKWTRGTETEAGTSTSGIDGSKNKDTCKVKPTSKDEYYWVTVTEKAQPGCSAQKKVVAHLSTIDKPTEEHNAACPGGTVTLTAYSEGAVDYTWKYSAGNIVGTGMTYSYSADVLYSTSADDMGVIVTTTNHIGCTSEQNEVRIRKRTKPDITADATNVCAGEKPTITLNGASQYEWVSENNYIGSSFVEKNPIYTDKTYTIHAWNMENGQKTCETDTTITVHINQKPNIRIEDDPGHHLTSTSICLNDSVKLTSIFPDGDNSVKNPSYKWKVDNNYALSSNNKTSITIKAKNDQVSQYKVVLKVTDGVTTCSDTTEYYVNVNPLPNVSIIPDKNPVCYGEQMVLRTNDVYDSYDWSLSTSDGKKNGSTLSSGDNYTIDELKENKKIRLEVKNVNNCVNWDTLTVRIKEKPTLTATADPICYEGNPVIKATGDVDFFNWPDGTTSTRANGSSGSWTGEWTSSTGLTGDRVFTVSASKSDCASDIKRITVKVYPKQELSFNVNDEATQGRPVMVCKDKKATIKITTNGLSDIQWAGLSSHEATITPTIEGESDFTATANVLIPNTTKSCPATGTQKIMAYPTTRVTLTGGGSVCKNEEMTFTANGSESYNWHFSNKGAGTIICNSSDSSEITVKNITEGFTVYATGTDANGCGSERSENKEVTILPSPTISVSQHENVICSGDELKMTVTTDKGTVTWIQGTGASGNEVSTTLTTQNGSQREEVYKAEATYTNETTHESCTATQDVTITVMPLPELILDTKGAICEGDSTTITAKEIYGASVKYAWNGSSNYEDKETITVKRGGTYSVSAQMTGGKQCKLKEPLTTTITEVPLPTMSGIELTGSPCKNDRITLNPKESNGASYDYEWHYITSKPDTISIEKNKTLQPIITQDTTFYVVASITQNFSKVTLVCKSALDTFVKMNPDPEFGLQAETKCYGENMTIKAVGDYRYEWTWDGNQRENGKSEITIEKAEGSHIFNVTATSNDGCTASKDTMVTVHPLPIINGFSGESVICMDNQHSVLSVICDNQGSIRDYTWQSNSVNRFENDATDKSKITIKPVQSQSDATFTVTVTDNNGCSASKDYSIDIEPMPRTKVVSEAICQGDPTSITVSDANDMSDVTYTWYEYDSSKPDNNYKGDNIGSGDKLEKEIAQETKFVVTASSKFGCETDTTVTAEIQPTPIIEFEG